MTVVNQVRLEGPLNQFVVEWDVAGALDGATTAPGLQVVNNGIVAGQQDEDAVFRIPVDGDAGIFDLDALGKRGAYGDRYLQWIRIESAIPIPPGMQVWIVDASALVPSLGVPIQLQEVTAGFVFVGQTSFYLSEIFLVPQGAAIQIIGIPEPPAGQTHAVKMGIRSASTAREDAKLENAMCCVANQEAGGGGTPAPTETPTRQFYDFSGDDLETLAGPPQDYYFQFTSYMNVPLFAAATFNNNRSDTIMNPLSGEGGIVSIAAEKLILRAGSATGLVMRLLNTGGGVPLASVEPFIEIAVGPGAFVRTSLAPAQAMTPNINVVFPVTPVDFPVDSRIRMGFTVTELTVFEFDMIASVEMTTPA
jgi:hypothetical protein